MNKQFPRRQIKIRPLTEGIGLGVLQSPAPSQRSHDVDSSVMRQAHAAYAPHSVANEIRRRSRTRALVGSARFVAGFGLDLLVGVFSLFILSWAGVVAWNAGANGVVDPISALRELTAFVGQMAVVTGVAIVLCVAALARFVRKIS